MRLSTVISIFALAGATAFAMPPRQGRLDIPQPDGSVIEAELYGNGHWCEYISPDGRVLSPDAGGWLVPGTVMLSDCASREAYLNARATVSVMNSRNTVSSYPTKGKIRTLVILAEFADTKFMSDNAVGLIERMLSMSGFIENGATGSVCDYFRDSSFGLFELDPVIKGPVVLPNNMSYYGAPDGSRPDARPAEMIRDACMLVDDDTDFSEFDLDNDGFIDNVYVFYPGYSQADGASVNTIWPHSGFIWPRLNADFDGKKLNKYACSNEIDMSTRKLVGIGTFCHEFSHVLGLPDLYSTDYSNEEHPATWSIMASGGRNNNGHTPPLYSAYERYALGWLDPAALTATGDDCVLVPGENAAYMISTENDNEFYIIENRQRNGWDAHIPGHGMLVWHIDYDRNAWQNNTVNNDATHQRIDLVEADGSSSSDSRSGDSYPGSSDVSEIPEFRTFAGQALGLGIFNIREEAGGRILFNAAGTRDKLAVPAGITISDVSPVSFAIGWNAVDGAETYVLEVFQKIRNGSVFIREYVDGYRLFMTEGECRAVVTGLNPSTQYHCRVRALGGSRIGDYSAEQPVTTLEADFRSEIPGSADATDVCADGFTANWLELSGARSYSITVREMTAVTAYSRNNDFADGIMTPPEWFVTPGCTTSTFSGYYGSAAPGLSMTSDNASVRSPLEDGMVTAVKFWCRGVRTEDRNTLTVSGYDGRQWRQLKEISPLVTDRSGEYITIEDEFANVPCYSVNLSFARPLSKGTLVLDDISVSHVHCTGRIVEGYDGLKVGNVLSARVTGLKPGILYSYTVTADNGTLVSQASTPRLVRTDATSGIDTPSTVDAGVSVTAGVGSVVVTNNTTADTALQLFNLTGTCVRQCMLPSGDAVTLSVDNGMYIAVAGGKSFKIIVGGR